MSTPLHWPAALVHWSEGLFLQPHHFQRLERGLREQIQFERRLAWAYPWGVIEARLAEGDLANRKIRFTRLHAIMPSGLEVRLGENTELEPLDIAKEFDELGTARNSLGVVLAVPLWSETKANTLDLTPAADRRAKRLYRLVTENVPDENSGQNSQRVPMRLLNARLLVEEKESTAPDPELEILPLLRVVRVGGEQVGGPSQNRQYAPPCLVLGGAQVLLELVHDVAEQVEGARKDLVEQIRKSGFSPDIIHWPELRQLLRLRTLGRFSGRLPALVRSPAATPFAVYLELRDLLGELVALQPDLDSGELPDYDHRNLGECFDDLCRRIRPLLRDTVAQTVLRVPFVLAEGMQRVNLGPQHLVPGAAYYVGIKTQIEPSALARYVVDGDQFKLMPPTQALRAVRGVTLVHRPFVSFLPAQGNLHYFQLEPAANEQSATMWERVRQEQAAVIPSLGAALDWSDSDFTLYITIPQAPVSS